MHHATVKGKSYEHLHQWIQNFCKFAHRKPTFSILHSYFYKTPTSVCLLYTFIQIKYSKPNHHQPNQYPATINLINTQTPSSTHSSKSQPPSTRSIPTDQYPSKSSTVSPPSLTHLPRIKLSEYLKLLPLLLLSPPPDPHIMSLIASPWRRFWVSFVVVCLLISMSLLLCGLPSDLNEHPPFFFFFFLTISFGVLESSELLQ